MNERPGPDIGVPTQQHQVVAMLWLLSTCQNKTEAQLFLRALELCVRQLWGWEPERLKAALIQAEQVLRTYSGRTTFWFTERGMEFDYDCTPPPVSEER
jgi:hypothetical protein